MTLPQQPPNTAYAHNPSVDESFADAGACGQTHLPTGRSCVLPRCHGGSCEFVPRDRAEAILRERAQ